MSHIRPPSRALSILGHIAACFLGEDRPGVVLAHVHLLLAEAIGVSVFYNYLVAADRPDWLSLESSGALTGDPRPGPAYIAFGELLCGEVARTGGRIVVADAQADLSPRAARIRAAGIGVYAGFPLLAAGQLLGTLAFCSHDRTSFDCESLELLQAVCDLVAGRLHRDRLAAASRAAEERLQETSQLVKLALDAAGDVGTFMVDLADQRCRGDSHLARLYDLPVEAVELGVPVSMFADRVHPDDLQGVMTLHALGSVEVPEYHNEYRIRTAAGAERWVEVRGLRLYDAAGRPVRLVGVVIDTTQRKQQELHLDRLVQERTAALQESLTRERLLIEHHPDILWVARVEPAGDDGLPRIVYEAFNAGAKSEIGVSGASLIGRTPHECFPPAAADAMMENYVACLRAGVPTTYNLTIDFPLGARHFETTMVPVRNVDGMIARIIGNARDVTERVENEEQRRQGQKMEAIGRLAAGVAHDFNNILQSVLGALDLLRDDLPPRTEAMELVDIATRAGRRGAQLTNHLLSYARRQMLLPRTVAVAELLGQLIPTLRRTMGPHIEIALDIVDPGAAVHVDMAMFETAIINLAVNAAHAMPQRGCLTFRLSSHPALDGLQMVPGPCAVLSVEDDGTGIAPDVLPRVFDPFFSTKGLDGTGLGLPMVQGFVRQSGGDVTLVSRPGHGTTVQLWLPLRQPPASERAIETSVGRMRGRALLVDDDPEVLVTTAAFLRRAGLNVTAVNDGAGALEHLSRNEAIDVVVTDFAMPGLNGLDLARDIRAGRPTLPIVVITGYADALGPASVEGVTILSKPFRRDQLIAVVDRAMGFVAAA